MKKNSNSNKTGKLLEKAAMSLHNRIRQQKSKKKTHSLMMAKTKTMKMMTILITVLTADLRKEMNRNSNSDTLVQAIVLLKLTNHKRLKHQKSFLYDFEFVLTFYIECIRFYNINRFFKMLEK